MCSACQAQYSNKILLNSPHVKVARPWLTQIGWLAGIYGPGRCAIDTVRKVQGNLIQCGDDDIAVVSRIHVDDVVNVVMASMFNPTPGLVVNVADNQPCTRYEVSGEWVVRCNQSLLSTGFASLLRPCLLLSIPHGGRL